MSLSLRWILLGLAMALLGTLPSSALARVPLIVGTPTVDNPRFTDVPNTMMYTVTVQVDRMAYDVDHVAKVGFVDSASYQSCKNPTTEWHWAPEQMFSATDTETWTLYNFQPGTTYYYRVQLGGPGASTHRSYCGELTTTDAPTPTIPDALASLSIEFHKAGTSNPFSTRYVIMETGDCGGRAGGLGATDYIVALDAENESIVWYLDIGAASGAIGASTIGWRYQPGTTTTSGRLLVLTEEQELFEWGFDGAELLHYEFGLHGECDGAVGSAGPCPHHDAYYSDVTGRTHVLASAESPIDAMGTGWETACGTESRFVDDGILTIADDGTEYSDYSLMNDYDFDPAVYGGPNAGYVAALGKACDSPMYHNYFEFTGIDWTHVNSIAASRFGPAEVLDISLKEWDAVLRFNASTGARLWTLASNTTDGDFAAITTDVAGATTFAAPHDVHEVSANELMMFDNLGDPTGSRVLRMAMDYTNKTAAIDRSWVVVDESGTALSCPVEGSGELVPDSEEHVLANCNDENTVVELSDFSGDVTGAAPPLVISLPDSGWCTTGGPIHREDIWGWHRAFPAVGIGAF